MRGIGRPSGTIAGEKRAKDRILRALAYLGMFCAVVVFLFPIVWIVLTSFKERLVVLEDPPAFVFTPTLENYRALIREGFGRFFVNSPIVVSVSTVLAVGLGSFASYALARYRTRTSKHLGFWILTQRMLPPIAIVIPLFLLFRTLGLLDTHLSLIIVYTLFNIPLSVWVMKSFFEDIPIELEEAGLMDGHSFWTVYRRIIFPLALPGIVTAAALSVVLTWNEFLFALVLTGDDTRTLPVATATFIASRGIEWGNMTAASVTIMIPVLLLVIAVQKRLVKGLTHGAVKG